MFLAERRAAGILEQAYIWDLLVGGLAIGCVYSLVALGFAMIIRATGIIHFAQGEVMMLGSMSALSALWLLPRLPAALVMLVGMLASALVSVAMALDVDGNRVRDARIALGGVAHKQWRARAAEHALIGHALDATAISAAGRAATEGAHAYRDNGFKVALAERAVVRAARIAGGLA